MPILEWDERYSIGIKKVDKQHTEIAGYINKLHELLGSNNKKEIIELLRKLNKAVDEHFATEEKLMQKYRIFNIFSHTAQHNRLSRILDENLEEVEEGNKELNEQFIMLMRDWMINHHKFHDKKMGEELVKKGAK
jgi:hemerythrin-like metal-binding protein